MWGNASVQCPHRSQATSLSHVRTALWTLPARSDCVELQFPLPRSGAALAFTKRMCAHKDDRTFDGPPRCHMKRNAQACPRLICEGGGASAHGPLARRRFPFARSGDRVLGAKKHHHCLQARVGAGPALANWSRFSPWPTPPKPPPNERGSAKFLKFARS